LSLQKMMVTEKHAKKFLLGILQKITL
jgi:hypothetical protein